MADTTKKRRKTNSPQHQIHAALKDNHVLGIVHAKWDQYCDNNSAKDKEKQSRLSSVQHNICNTGKGLMKSEIPKGKKNKSKQIS